MSNIDIRRFVDINIKHSISRDVDHERSEVVLLTKDSSLEADSREECSSLKDFEEGSFYSNLGDNPKDTDLYKYVAFYFANGGVKLKIIKINTYSDSTSFINNALSIIDSLGDKFIVYAYADAVNSQQFMISLASTLTQKSDKYSGIKQKVILARCGTDSIPSDIKDINNLALKSSNAVGSEMTIGAYLSRIDVYGTETVQDYAYTREISYSENISLDENIDDDTFKNIIESNCNVDIYLAGSVRNCGGNLTNGLDLVNQYVLIILHQTLTDRVLSVLANKIKGQTGVNIIHTTIVSEMDRYLLNGYLNTDRIWNRESVEITYNGQSYSIIEADTPLDSGYKVVILPISSLSDDDIKNHSVPPIYVILSDSYGIRYVTINGEVI